MAYKFQLGAAVLSGSLTQEGQILAKDSKISGSSIGLTDASGLAEVGGGIADSGDGTLELSIDGMDGVAFDVSQDKIFFSAVGNALGNIRSGSLADLATGFAGNGLAASSGVLSVGVDNESIEIFGDELRVAAGGITNAMLSGSIDNAKLANQSVTVTAGDGLGGGGAVNLGAAVSLSVNVDDSSIETNADALRVKASGITNAMLAGSITANKMNNAIFEDLETLGAASSDGEFIVATGAGAFAYESGNTARTSLGLGTGDNVQFTNLTLSGDLTVNGSTTTISTTELTVEDSNITIADAGDASTAGYGLTIGSSNTVTFQTAQTNGANSLASSVPLSASTYYGDGSNLTGLTADSAATTEGFPYNTYDATSTAITNLNGNAGFYVASGSGIDPLSGSANTTIHLSGSWSNGEVVYIKAPSNASTFNVTIAGSGNERIDGQPSVVLESDHAAVTLLRAHNSGWVIV